MSSSATAYLRHSPLTIRWDVGVGRFPGQGRFLECPTSLKGSSSRPGPTAAEQTSLRADRLMPTSSRRRPEAQEPRRPAAHRVTPAARPHLALRSTSWPEAAAHTWPHRPTLASGAAVNGTGSCGGCSAGRDLPTRGFAEGCCPAYAWAQASPSRVPRVESPAGIGWRREARLPAVVAHAPAVPAPELRAAPRPSASAGSRQDQTDPARWPGKFGGAWGWRAGFPTGKKHLARPPP